MPSELNRVERLRRQTPDEKPKIDVAPPAYPWKTRVLVPASVAFALVAITTVSFYDALAPAIDVRVAPVVQKSTNAPASGAVMVQAAGWIEPDPYMVHVSALADGIVDEVLVLEGDTVTKGQVVARMVDDDARLELQQAEAALAEAESNLLAARATLEAAQTDWDNPVALDREVAVTGAALDEAQALLQQVAAELVADQAIADEARRTFLRAEQLLNQDDVGTESELDQIRARHLASVAQVDATRNRNATVRATIARLEAELAAATETRRLRSSDRERLDNTRAEVQRAEAAVASANVRRDEKVLQLERMEVRAPSDGVVVRRLVSPGAKLVRNMDAHHSSHVVHLYDPAKLQVRVDVPLADAALIGVGQPAEIGVEVLANTTFRGLVSRVTHEADLQKNTLEVKVAIEDPRPELRPEMLARVKFLAMAETDETGERSIVMLPADAIFDHEGETRVWVVVEQRGNRGIADLRSIAVRGSPKNDEWIEAERGLNPGDRVVLNPPSDLRDGARVNVLAES